jgi:hypothetical protein
MGSTPTETAPAITITMEITLAKMGCSMKNLEIIFNLTIVFQHFFGLSFYPKLWAHLATSW